ncbi:hypothetical protein R3P38DRAFT_2552473 [Favolaschia claudopus]|uniref:F-box domain-containing protein n=1 Tax=Favolaschia claudopus TaxID=2862362 RepID=A0AAW0AFY1_9AGAR
MHNISFHTPSPFVDRLGTNYVPSDEEIPVIRRLVHSDSLWARELVWMDEQIQGIELSLRQIKEKRDAFKGNIDAHKALVSPMRFAPDDILREIFIACLPSATNALMDPREAPLLFGRICRHWRDIALSTPMLWASIHIPLTVRAGIELSAVTLVLERWLNLSGGCPLAISLYSDDYESSLDPCPMISMVLDVASRLRRLSLRGPLHNFLRILSLGSDSLPCLSGLELSNRGQPDFQLFKDHPKAMNIIQIPSLTRIAVSSAGMQHASLPLIWSQLTSLSLFQQNDAASQEFGHFDGNKALEVLRRCPSLRHCSLGITETDSHLNQCALSSNSAHISLPFLESLTLNGGFRLSSWIPNLSVPKLSYLCIGFMPNRYPYGTFPYTSLGTVVRISSGFLTSSGLFDVLSSLPLTHLELSCAYPDDYLYDTGITVDDAFLGQLCPPHSLCPLLTHFMVTGNAALKFSAASMTVFIVKNYSLNICARCAMHGALLFDSHAHKNACCRDSIWSVHHIQCYCRLFHIHNTGRTACNLLRTVQHSTQLVKRISR